MTPRRALGFAVLAAIVLGGGLAVYRQRHEFALTLQRFDPGVVSASVGCALVGVAASFPVWRAVLGGLGVPWPWPAGARLFFTTQLGKYIPGSVWPVLLQMEAGRARGASRQAMVAGNLMTNLLNCCIGLLVGCALLPAYDSSALAHYGWALLALPVLIAVLHPRVIPGALDRVAGWMSRSPLGARVPIEAELQAAAWSLLSWVALGLQLTVLCAALGHGGVTAFLLCTGGMALAFAVGLLFIPAPAGAGVREVVLALVLSSSLTYPQALTVAVASRVTLIGCDLALAAFSTLVSRALAAN